uniref:G-protein coupled receptors family 1 profile domain-containing protein n=1 Tax=Acrobeloides nanus TaxID=290746 RepID=A0A914D8Q1_9BILA
MLDFGEIINGLSYILTGIGRGTHALDGTFNVPISIHDCFFTRYWPIPLILGTQVPSLIMVVMSTERIFAVHKPALYSYYFNTKNKIIFIFLIAVVQILTIIWAGLSAWGDNTLTSTQHCAISGSTSKIFSTFHFTIDVLGYVISFVSLTTIYIIHRVKYNQPKQSSMYGSNKKGPHLMTYMVMTFIDIVLCAMPSVVMIGSRWGLFTAGNLLVSLTYSTTGFLSLVHTVMNYVFFVEYRKQLKIVANNILKKLGFSPLKSKSQVITVTAFNPTKSTLNTTSKMFVKRT